MLGLDPGRDWKVQLLALPWLTLLFEEAACALSHTVVHLCVGIHPLLLLSKQSFPQTVHPSPGSCPSLSLLTLLW